MDVDDKVRACRKLLEWNHKARCLWKVAGSSCCCLHELTAKYLLGQPGQRSVGRWDLVMNHCKSTQPLCICPSLPEAMVQVKVQGSRFTSFSTISYQYLLWSILTWNHARKEFWEVSYISCFSEHNIKLPCNCHLFKVKATLISIIIVNIWKLASQTLWLHRRGSRVLGG